MTEPTGSAVSCPPLLSHASTPSRDVTDEFMEDDPLRSCVIVPSAVVRGVSTARSSGTEPSAIPAPPAASHAGSTQPSMAEQPEAMDDSRSSPSLFSSEETLAYRGVVNETVPPPPASPTASTSADPPPPAQPPATSFSEPSQAGPASAVTSAHPPPVTQPSVSAVAQPPRPRSRMLLTDDEIVAHFTAHSQENEAVYASELYYGGNLTHDAAIALSQDMCRVKKILVKYSTDLLLRLA